MGFRLASDNSRPYSLRTVPFTSNSSTYEHFLSQLSRGAQYSVVVKAFNSAGSGPESVEAMATTMSGELPPAPKVHLVSFTTDSVSLLFRMRREELPNLRLTGFAVHYRSDAVSVWKEASIPVDMSRGDGSYVVKDLIPNSVYFFYVTAVSNAGHGDPSELLTIKTRATDAPVLGEVPFTPGDRPPVMFGNYQQDVQTFVSVGAVVIVLLTLIISFVCVKKAKLDAQKPPNFDYMHTMGRGSDPSGAYVETMRRYVDLDNSGKPVMQGNVVMRPPPHAHELKSFSPGKKPWPRSMPHPNEASSRNQAYMLESEVYDCPQ